MIPVLAVRDPGAAKGQLREMFGFRDTASDRLALGDQEILVCAVSRVPQALVALPFDHLALSVKDVDRALEAYSSHGGELDPDFTPEGPVDIPEFWGNGVRFVFFQGPDGAPLEFCQKLGAETGPGHSHYGVRTPLLDETEGALSALGARRVARHILSGTPPVEVRFLALGNKIFELFNAAPSGEAHPNEGWIGFIDAQV